MCLAEKEKNEERKETSADATSLTVYLRPNTVKINMSVAQVLHIKKEKQQQQKPVIQKQAWHAQDQQRRWEKCTV